MKTFTKFLAGAVTILAFAMIGCQTDTDTHEHTYSTEWSKDATSHWHAATCEHTSEVSDKADHTFGEAVVTKEATETETGIKTSTCTVCKYVKTESIAVLPHTHKYSADWKSDATSHWHAATCEHTSEVKDKAAHTFGEAVVTKPATETEAGVKTYTCTVCKYEKTEEIPVLHTHKYSAEWTSDATSHWHAATCEHTTEVSDKADHTFPETEVGKKTFTCTVCNYQRSVAVGDIIYTDGTISSKDAELTSGKTPVAVVAGFNTNGVMFGLGLKQSSSFLQWAPNYTTGLDTKFTKIIAYSDNTGTGAGSTATITGDTDGSDNWEYVKSIDPKGTADAATNYPAFNFAATYATTAGITGEIAEGWYMPSIAELCELYKNKDTLNTSLSKCSGTQFMDNWYWSSSQYDSSYYAWALGFSDGYLGYGDLDSYNYVCCVRAF